MFFMAKLPLDARSASIAHSDRKAAVLFHFVRAVSSSLRGAKRRSNPSFFLLPKWIASLRSQ
jgi:hypothetical protein